MAYSPISEELKDGPLKDRRCTDVLICLVFTAFLVCFFSVGISGFAQGNPDLIIYPHDSSGNLCGRPDTVTSSYKYLYYPTPTENTDYKVCVKSCPTGSSDVKCHKNTWVTDCSFEIRNSDNSTSKVDPYVSDEYLKRYCMPDKSAVDDLDEDFNKVIDAVYEDSIRGWASDIYRCWTAILIVLALAIGFSVLYLVLLRYCIGIMIWLVILACIGLLILFAAYLDYAADNTYSGDNHEKTRKALRICAIFGYIMIGVFIFLLLFMIRRISLAIAVMKSGAIFMKDVWWIIIVPAIVFLAGFAFYIYWVLALVYIYSSGKLENKDSYEKFSHMSWNDSTRHSFLFEFIGVLWINSFKVALSQFVIASAVCYWYFSDSRLGLTHHILSRSAYHAFRYHLGSLAFGSLLLAIIKFIKWYFIFLKEKVHKEGLDKNCCVKFLCGCIGCYVMCFERFIKYIDKHAYIQIALSGDGFCKAAKNAFEITLENAARFAALGSIGDIFTFIGKFFITTLSSYFGFLIITHCSLYSDHIQSPIPSTLVFIIISYSVSGLFVGVYEMSCDTIIQVFLVDEKIHKGSPQFAPEPLKDFMHEHRNKEHKPCCGFF